MKWTRKSLDTLDNAVEYIAGDNPAAAHKVAPDNMEIRTTAGDSTRPWTSRQG